MVVCGPASSCSVSAVSSFVSCLYVSVSRVSVSAALSDVRSIVVVSESVHCCCKLVACFSSIVNSALAVFLYSRLLAIHICTWSSNVSVSYCLYVFTAVNSSFAGTALIIVFSIARARFSASAYVLHSQLVCSCDVMLVIWLFTVAHASLHSYIVLSYTVSNTVCMLSVVVFLA